MSDEPNDVNPKSRNPKKPIGPDEAVRLYDPTEQEAVDAAVVATNAYIREKVDSRGEVTEIPAATLGKVGRVRYNVIKGFRDRGWEVASKAGSNNTTVYDFKRKKVEEVKKS